MKLSRVNVAELAEESIRGALKGVPEIKLMRLKARGDLGELGPDLIVRIKTPFGVRDLVFEVRSSGEPRLAREAINQLYRYREEHPEMYGVFLAPYISPRTAEVCQSEDIGHIDLSGNCRLSFDGIFIEKEGRPNKYAERRDLRSLYSAKASRILRVLLNKAGKAWRVKEVAESAEVSIGLVSNVKKLLGDREWIREEKEGFSLNRPFDLLAEWSGYYSFRRNKARDYYSLKTPAQLESELASLCSQRGVLYAFTAFSAAARMSPAVIYQRVFAFINESIEEIARDLEMKEVSSGANVTLLQPHDAGIFIGALDFDGIRTVSPIQVYLDLVGFRGRGEEAASAILEEVIRPHW